ncbi:MAG: UDP-N-acetyl-D-galactosamine dehydrogenase [Enterobacterales bacterium]|jgi:UDP-N-acetyl-D-galactosamine dehydrogenase
MPQGRRISVIGLGYVGLPVAIAFAQTEQVIGFDVNQSRIDELKRGEDSTNEADIKLLKKADIIYTNDPVEIKKADFHIVAVPTPVNSAKEPDLTPVLKASEEIGRQLKVGDIVVYESTVYPGATEEDCIPVLERVSGLICGQDFFVGYSPERINPGDKEHTFTTITKVVSGQTPEVLDIVAKVYESVVTAGVHKASSIKVAEACKVIENTQRDLNIALMNELAMIFQRMDIDTKDVLDAAATKWNFLRFSPGLVGGHCIGVDPYYLTHKASSLGYIPDMILDARAINDGMGSFIASRVVKSLIKAGVTIKGSTITILGFTFKENVPDLRNTRVIDIVKELSSYGINVQITDTQALAEEAHDKFGIELIDEKYLQKADGLILAVPHEYYLQMGWIKIQELLKQGKGLIYDVKSVLPRETRPNGIELLRL